MGLPNRAHWADSSQLMEPGHMMKVCHHPVPSLFSPLMCQYRLRRHGQEFIEKWVLTSYLFINVLAIGIKTQMHKPAQFMSVTSSMSCFLFSTQTVLNLRQKNDELVGKDSTFLSLFDLKPVLKAAHLTACTESLALAKIKKCV